jgi:hypothetical protein
MAKKGRATTEGQSKPLSKATQPARKHTASASKKEAWPPRVALGIASDVISGIQHSGTTHSGTIGARVLNMGADVLAHGQAPTVCVFIAGAWYCDRCGTLNLAPTSADSGTCTCQSSGTSEEDSGNE